MMKDLTRRGFLKGMGLFAAAAVLGLKGGQETIDPIIEDEQEHTHWTGGEDVDSS